MTQSDPEYLRLYKEYAHAIRAYENAVRDRRSKRARFKAKNKESTVRRPVGSPSDFKIPPEDKKSSQPTQKPIPHRIYLGPILGWAKIIYTESIPPATDPSSDIKVEKFYDQISLELYWSKKNHYDKCKRAFFDYVRRRNIDLHREHAREELRYEAMGQMLGFEDQEDGLKEAQAEIEAACQAAWKIYQSNPEPRSTEVIKLLLQSLSDGQLVGLESQTVRQMEAEVTNLLNSGKISKG